MKVRVAAFFRLPFLPVWLAPFVLFAPLLLTGKALFWGTPYLQFVPWWNYAWETLKAGHLPLWNPLVGMGAPLLANYQSALFYPPHWLYFLLAAMGGAPALAWGQALLAAAHLAWAGLGMVFLTRRLGLGILAQTIAGLSFGLCGYLVARGSFLSILSAAAWLPWILSLVMGQGSKKAILLLALALALQLLAGHAQTAWNTLLLAAAWGGYWGWSSAHSLSGQESAGEGIVRMAKQGRLARFLVIARGIAGAWARLAMAGLLAVSLASVQLLPTAEYLLQSQRAASVNYELAMTYSFWPWRFLTLFAPGLYGNPALGNYWGYGNFWEDAAYIGLLPLLLAIAAMFKRNAESAARRRPFLIIIVLAAFLLALGKNTPIFPWLYRNMPGFDMFQAPARYLIWAEAALVLLAALGAEGWRRPKGRGLYWTRLGTAGALAISIGAGLAWLLMGEVSPTFIRATALAGGWGVGAGVLALLAPPGDEPETGDQGDGDKGKALYSKVKLRRWKWAVVLFVAADLLAAGWGLNPDAPGALFRPATTAVEMQALQDGARLYIPEEDERQLKFERFFRFDSYAPAKDWSGLQQTLLPNSSMLADLPSANNFDPLIPGRYARWMGTLAEADELLRERMLSLMNVGLIERADLTAGGYASFKPANASGRVRWVECGRLARDEEDAWSLVTGTGVDLRREVVLEGGQPEACSGARPNADLTIIGENPNSLRIYVDTPQDGWLVLADVWYPSWVAQVDGEARPILRADYLFRAIRVNAGDHLVTFSYRPMSFWLGAAVSLLAWAWWSWKITRRDPIE